ncbi:MAG: SOS response-associated peptidase family protein [Proteobacteria bacterium]|nr:SOS response-associated peptidase family protein [Pseudomonadota bacterium]
MCSNYRLPTATDLVVDFDCEAPVEDFETIAYPGYRAPMMVMNRAGTRLVAEAAVFGLVPPWAKDMKIVRSTYNARAETVAEKPAFRAAWKKRQFCLVPMLGFFEPNYESGKPVRWQIRRIDAQPFALAGLREWRRQDDGRELRSFTMLTVNASDHPLMSRFHAPGDEKRSVVYVPAEDHAGWLGAASDEEARAYLKLMAPDEFEGIADPAPPRTKRSA